MTETIKTPKTAFVVYPSGELQNISSKCTLDPNWEARLLNKDQKLDAAKVTDMTDELKAEFEAKGYTVHYYEA